MQRILITFIISLIFVNVDVFPKNAEWSGYILDSISSSMDVEMQHFYYYRSDLSKKQPLVISLHQWSANYAEYKNSLAPEIKARQWNYIHPDFRGANKHMKSCGSDFVVSDIDDIIDWAIMNLPVDTTQIYVVGASGGGYAALCSFMKSKHNVKEYSVWVPITDLKRWYFESKSRKNNYANDIIRCTCGDCEDMDELKAMARSPLYWDVPVDKLKSTKIKLYAGIHDGYTGSVPIIHSLLFYNKIVESLGGFDGDVISNEDIIWLLTTRTSRTEWKNGDDAFIGNRKIIFHKSYENVSLVLFEGAHEILTNIVFE